MVRQEIYGNLLTHWAISAPATISLVNHRQLTLAA